MQALPTCRMFESGQAEAHVNRSRLRGRMSEGRSVPGGWLELLLENRIALNKTVCGEKPDDLPKM
jgi:hypothetical protein